MNTSTAILPTRRRALRRYVAASIACHAGFDIRPLGGAQKGSWMSFQRLVHAARRIETNELLWFTPASLEVK